MDTKKLIRLTGHQNYRTIPAGFIFLLIIVGCLTVAANITNAATYYLDAANGNDGPVSASGYYLTSSTKTVRKTNAFTSYIYHPGDQMQITAGTHAVAGFYTIASKVDNNSVTLTTNPTDRNDCTSATLSWGNDGTAKTTTVGTLTGPWKTLTKAKAIMVSGDTTYLADGNYGNFSEIGAVHTDWITYEARSGHNPIFTKIEVRNYTGTINSYLRFRGITVYHAGAYIRNVNYVQVYDCNFIGSGYVPGNKSCGVLFYLAKNIIIDGCKIYGDANGFVDYTSVSGIPGADFGKGYDCGIYFETASQNVTINNCDIRSCNTAISAVSGSNIVVSDNTIHYMSGDGITLGYCNTAASGLTAPVVISGNHIYAMIEYPATLKSPTTGWHNDGIQFNDVEINHAIIRGNHIHYSDGDAMFLKGSKTSTGNTNWLIENNLVYDTLRPANYSDKLQTVIAYNCDNAIFRNNTIVGKGSVQGAKEGSPPTPMTFTEFTNNIINRVSLNTSNLGTIVTYENHNIINTVLYGMAGYVWGANTIVLNSDSQYKALFNNFDSNDFSLAADSRAINFGNATHAPTTDILGNSRDSNPDAGCYEYVVPLSFPPIGNKEVNEGSTLTFRIDINDPNIKTSIEEHNLPSKPNFINQLRSALQKFGILCYRP